jgi:hypothetical protein
MLGLTIPKTKDEQIVNDSVTQLLKILTMYIPDVRCRWTTHRTPFPSVELGFESNSKMLTVSGRIPRSSWDITKDPCSR